MKAQGALGTATPGQATQNSARLEQELQRPLLTVTETPDPWVDESNANEDVGGGGISRGDLLKEPCAGGEMSKEWERVLEASENGLGNWEGVGTPGGVARGGASSGAGEKPGRVMLTLVEGKDPEPPPPGEMTARLVQEEVPDVLRLAEEGEW